MINLTLVQELLEGTVGSLQKFYDESALSVGERDVLAPCIGTLKSILEDIYNDDKESGPAPRPKAVNVSRDF